MGDLTDELVKQLGKFGKEKIDRDRTTGEKVGGAVAESIIPVALGIAGGAFGSLAGPIGTAAGATIGTALGEAINSIGIGDMMKSAGEVVGGVIESAGAVAMKSVGSLVDLVKAAPKAKEGGIIDSDTAGSLAVLHGREAVIPLDSGSKFLDDAIDNRLQQFKPANPAVVETGTGTQQMQRQMLDLVKQTMPAGGFKIGDVIKTLQEDNAVQVTRIANKTTDSVQNIAETAAREIAIFGTPISMETVALQQMIGKRLEDVTSDVTSVDQIQKQITDLIKNMTAGDRTAVGQAALIDPTGPFSEIASLMNRNTETNTRSMETVAKPLEEFNKGVSGFSSMFDLDNITKAFSSIREMMAKPFTEAYASMRSPESINTASNRMIEQNATDMANSRDIIAKLNDSITEMKNNQNRTVNAVTGSTDETNRDRIFAQQVELLAMINTNMTELNRVSRDIANHTERSSNAAY